MTCSDPCQWKAQQHSRLARLLPSGAVAGQASSSSFNDSLCTEWVPSHLSSLLQRTR